MNAKIDTNPILLANSTRQWVSEMLKFYAFPTNGVLP